MLWKPTWDSQNKWQPGLEVLVGEIDFSVSQYFRRKVLPSNVRHHVQNAAPSFPGQTKDSVVRLPNFTRMCLQKCTQEASVCL